MDNPGALSSPGIVPILLSGTLGSAIGEPEEEINSTAHMSGLSAHPRVKWGHHFDMMG